MVISGLFALLFAYATAFEISSVFSIIKLLSINIVFKCLRNYFIVQSVYTTLYAMRMYYLKGLTFPAMKQRPKESWKFLLNTIPAFKGSVKWLAGQKHLKIIHRWHHNCFFIRFEQFKAFIIA